LHVLNAKDEIIPLRKTNGQHRTSSSLISIVDFAGSILLIKRQNNLLDSQNGMNRDTFFILIKDVAGQ